MGIALDDHTKVGHLRRISSFVDYLSSEEFLSLARIATVQELPAGAGLYEEGDVADGFYVIKSGRIRFHRSDVGGGVSELGVLGAGSHFGLMNMIKESPRPSTATVLEAATVLVVARNDFELLLLHEPDLARKMMSLAVSR